MCSIGDPSFQSKFPDQIHVGVQDKRSLRKCIYFVGEPFYDHVSCSSGRVNLEKEEPETTRTAKAQDIFLRDTVEISLRHLRNRQRTFQEGV